MAPSSKPEPDSGPRPPQDQTDHTPELGSDFIEATLKSAVAANLSGPRPPEDQP